WGMYEFSKPILVVKDPDMLKTILVKECFTHFTNRRFQNVGLNGDFYDAVHFAEDDDWRRIRNNVSPFFTTGRIRQWFGLMKRQSSRLTSRLQPRAQNEDVVSVKDFFGPYSINTFTGCLLGVEVDSQLFLKRASNPFKVSIPLFILQACFPVLLPLLKMLGFSVFSGDSFKFVKKVVEKMRADRDGSSHQELDFLQHMTSTQMKAKKDTGNKGIPGLTDHEIVTQMTVLLAGGHEAVTLVLTLCAYSLATHPQSLRLLQQEVDSTFPDQAAVTLEALLQMEYLDGVVSECLRLYPSNPRLERTAKSTVKISGITIPKDMTVMVPVYALHRDPEHWPQPEEFQPDR
uniref:Cytochrome P450 3A n=1 Tax=Tetraodon nigroviridis TaxID=99883 RepID=H3C939_TETNG